MIRSQLEVSRILQTFTMLNQRRRTLVAKLNSLTLRPSETPIGVLVARPEVGTQLFAGGVDGEGSRKFSRHTKTGRTH